MALFGLFPSKPKPKNKGIFRPGPDYLLTVKSQDTKSIQWIETFVNKDEAIAAFHHMANTVYPESVFLVTLRHLERGKLVPLGVKDGQSASINKHRYDDII